MTSLRHIHWSFSYAIEAESPEVIQLHSILLRASNLSSLSIRCASRLALRSQRSIFLDVPLTSLTTLEYCGDPEQLVLLHKDMPNLMHIIATPVALDFRPIVPKLFPVLSVFGQQLKMIEFPNVAFPFNDIRSILDYCPNLHTLGYNINHVVFPKMTTVLHPSISVILLTTQKMLDNYAFEQCMVMHGETLTGEAFPALRKVVLEGSADWDVDGPQFYPAYLVMRQRFPSQRVQGATVVWEC